MNHLQASHLFDLADGLSAVIDSMHARDEDREHQAGLLAAAGHLSESLRTLAWSHVESANRAPAHVVGIGADLAGPLVASADAAGRAVDEQVAHLLALALRAESAIQEGGIDG